MALPQANIAKYELTLPSQQKTISFRPFLVKEEKILLMALESGKPDEMLRAIKEIVKSCTFGELEPDDYPLFDIEYVFLQIRAKSVGEVAKLKLLCPDDKETYANIELDLSKVEEQVDDDHTNEIQVNDKIKMLMKYPTIDSFDPSTDASKLGTQQLFDMIAGTIYEIYEGETVHKASDYSKEDMNKFIESLSSDQFAKIQKFFNTMPKLQHEVEIENPKTKVKSKVMLQGLQSFFVSPSHMTA